MSALLFAAVVSTGLGGLAWAVALSRLRAAIAALGLYVVPLGGALASHVGLDEPLYARHAVGALIVVAAILLGGSRRRAAPPPRRPPAAPHPGSRRAAHAGGQRGGAGAGSGPSRTGLPLLLRGLPPLLWGPPPRLWARRGASPRVACSRGRASNDDAGTCGRRMARRIATRGATPATRGVRPARCGSDPGVAHRKRQPCAAPERAGAAPARGVGSQARA